MVFQKSCHSYHNVTKIVRNLWEGWIFCWGLWTVALAGRIWWGPVVWVRFMWIVGLGLAVGFLVILLVISLAYGVRLISYRRWLFRSVLPDLQDSHHSDAHNHSEAHGDQNN